MEKETKQGIRGGILFLIIVICLLLGFASGYFLNEKLIKNEEPTKIEEKENEDTEEKGNEDTKEKEEEDTKEEEENKDAESEAINEGTSNKKSTSLDVSKECFNNENCEKELAISNGEKNSKVRVMSNGSEIYIYLNNEDILQFRINDPNLGKKRLNKIALLDTDHFVIEIKSDGMTERYYYDSNNIQINCIFSALYDNKFTINNEITDKETIHYKNASGCNADGSKRIIYKYKMTILDKNSYKNEYIGEDITGCAGQS